MDAFVEQLIRQYAYIGIFSALLACGFGVPIPEDIILFTSGYLCFRELIDLRITIAVAMCGVLIGDSIIFFFGRKLSSSVKAGKAALGPFKHLLTPQKLNKIWKSFSKYGNKIIFGGRFAAGLRAPLFFTAGLSGMPYHKFIFWDALAAMISVPLFTWLAFHFGEEIDALKGVIIQSKKIAAIVIVSAIAVFVIYKVVKHKRAPQEEKEADIASGLQALREEVEKRSPSSFNRRPAHRAHEGRGKD
jgi:membrane protein DedA with SNARE-associated domain